ncbi:cupin domain-containing protein [Novosphingobium sp. KA1]|uniref:cupin domain-containing protein n=1 Tax=Novosphingobium sp. (strain KA1) TaxID=164608 RepID=UPI001A8EF507|nr:cupin domain-containing protein [Novosphingobium sp. KA1]QSR19995.1 hypothetical protein CA833_22870 [Novosphingobium sp. KA1]
MTAGIAAKAPYIDLGAFAAAAGSSFGEDWRAARVGVPVPQDGMRIDALLLAESHGIATSDLSEIVLVREGTLSLTADGVTLRLDAGEAALVPAGTTFHWRAATPVRAIVVGAAKPGPDGARLTRIDFAAAHEPSARPNPDLLVGDKEPACAQHVDFRSADTLFYAGTWSSTPYHRLPMPYAHWEVMLLLEGDVAFGDADGNEATARPGDLVVIPAGSVASWRGIGPTRKLFVILRS